VGVAPFEAVDAPEPISHKRPGCVAFI